MKGCGDVQIVVAEFPGTPEKKPAKKEKQPAAA